MGSDESANPNVNESREMTAQKDEVKNPSHFYFYSPLKGTTRRH